MKIRNVLNDLIFKRKYTLDEVQAIYATHIFGTLAESLLGLYIPIYIFNISKDLLNISNVATTNGFLWVISFFTATSAAVIVSTLTLEKVLFRLKLKKAMFISKLFLILNYAFLTIAEQNIYLVLLAAFFSGLHITLYWIPYHIFFIKKADDGDKKYGTEIGKRGFLVGISSTLGPLLGALLIERSGFPVLYGFAIFLLIIGTLPMLIFVKEGGHREHTFSDVYLKFLINKKYFKTSIALSGSVIAGIISVIFWSLTLYFGLRDFVKIGFLTTSASLIALILLLVVGKIIDLKGKKTIHIISATITAILNATRAMFASEIFMYSNVLLSNANGPSYNVPFNAAIYEKSLKGSVSDFIIYRELVLHIARLVILVLIGFVLYLTNSWSWVFCVSAIGALLTILVNF